MEKGLVDRINELARKKKEEGLTEEEQKEQKELYDRYLRNFRANFRGVVDNTVVQQEDGTKIPLRDYNRMKKQ